MFILRGLSVLGSATLAQNLRNNMKIHRKVKGRAGDLY
jgi:hypothetical protein